MRHLWMGIVPDPMDTRVLVLDGPDDTLLQARLPHGPQHPRAVEALAEAIALWAGRPVRVVLAAHGPGSFCATRPWLDTFDEITRSALYEIHFVTDPVAPREPHRLGELGDFRDLRRLVIAELAR